MGKSTVPICPSVCGNALSRCVNTWFLKWNNEEYLWLQIKTDGEARKSHFFSKTFFTTKNGKVHGPIMSVCPWECFERVCHYLIFEMKWQWIIFTTTTKDRQRKSFIKLFYYQKWKSPWFQSVLESVGTLWAGVSTPDFWNETAMNNIYDYKERQMEKPGNLFFSLFFNLQKQKSPWSQSAHLSVGTLWVGVSTHDFLNETVKNICVYK